jgi:hypothetical protein
MWTSIGPDVELHSSGPGPSPRPAGALPGAGSLFPLPGLLNRPDVEIAVLTRPAPRETAITGGLRLSWLWRRQARDEVAELRGAAGRRNDGGAGNPRRPSPSSPIFPAAPERRPSWRCCRRFSGRSRPPASPSTSIGLHGRIVRHPHPEGPTKTTSSPSSTLRLTSCTGLDRPERLRYAS